MYVLYTILFCAAGLVLYLVISLLVFLIRSRPRRPREPGFEFVYVNDDGSARELDADEREYLSTKFEFGDGGRPYIKGWYEETTPDYKLRGYLRRRQLPKRILLKSN